MNIADEGQKTEIIESEKNKNPENDLSNVKKISSRKKKHHQKTENQIWLSVSEAAKIGGVQTKTIRRAIKAGTLKYKIINNRYLIDFKTLVIFLSATTKLKNKFNQCGVGQYADNWQIE
jgi:excisionase family DNA binding protein